MTLYISETKAAPSASAGGLNALMSEAHDLMLMAGFAQTSHPDQLEEVEVSDVTTAAKSYGYRLYELQDAYSENSPVFVKMEIRTQFHYATQGIFPYVRFMVGVGLDESGEFAGDYIQTESTWGVSSSGSSFMRLTSGKNCVIVGDGYLVVGLRCGAKKATREQDTYSTSLGTLIISRLRGEEGQVIPDGVMVYGRGFIPIGESGNTTTNGRVQRVRNRTSRVGLNVSSFSQDAVMMPYMPISHSFPITGESGFTLQHPMALGKFNNLYADTKFGFALTDKAIPFGSILDAEIDGEDVKIVSLNGIGISPIVLNNILGQQSYHSDAAYIFNFFSDDIAMWVQVPKEDW